MATVVDAIVDNTNSTITKRLDDPYDLEGPFKSAKIYGRFAVNVEDASFPIKANAQLIELPEALVPDVTYDQTSQEPFVRIRWDDAENLAWWLKITIRQWETPTKENASSFSKRTHIEGRALPRDAAINRATLNGEHTLVINWTSKNSPFWAELVIEF